MWKRVLSAAHRAGFTRNETAVLLFLGASLLAGMGLRSLRGGNEIPREDVRLALQRQDSLFAAAAIPPGSADGGDTQGSPPAEGRDPASDPSGETRSSRDVPAAKGSIDINAADAAALERLPGIGPATARKIVEHRTRSGPFRRPEDLLKVKGIGPKKFEQLRQFIIVE